MERNSLVRASLTRLAILVLPCLFFDSSAFAKPPVTLDDAYAVKSVGAIAVSPDGDLLAMEAEGGIVVLTIAKNARHISRLEGISPSWSPDGRRLAYFSNNVENRQLQVWTRGSTQTKQITNIPGGISPNTLASSVRCSPWSISWAPDSSRVVFGSRLMGTSATSTPAAPPQIQVFDSKTPLDLTLSDGIFKDPSIWDVAYPGNPDLGGERMKRAWRDSAVGRNRLLVVDIEANTWSELTGRANQYVCPAWSADGKYIAAAADTSSSHPITYTSPGISVTSSALVIFDMATRQERLIETPTVRVGVPVWSSDSDHIALMVQTDARLASFPRILNYSLSSDESSFLAAPQGQAVKEVRRARDGKALIVALWDRFSAGSIWRMDPKTGDTQRIATLDKQVDSFGEAKGGTFVLNTQSADSKGLVVLASKGHVGILYNTNPQIDQLDLGAQRRVTWRNKAGDDVDGIIVLPPDYEPGKRYPVIADVYPRVPADDFKLTSHFEFTGQLQAAHGYIVFTPGLRAPHAAYIGGYVRDENYTEKARGVAGIPIMVDDFTSGIDHLVREGIADPNRIGLFGHSNGGWATNLLITRTSIAKAALIEAGVSNAVLMAFFPKPQLTRGVDPATNGNVFDNFQDYVALSPIFRMRDVNIPIMLMLGDQDWLWVPQMISQYATLRSEGKDVQLIRYSNEGHLLRSRASVEDALNRMNTFFDRHLKR